MAINPMEREGCWLCDDCGEVETHRASDDAPMTVGCPVCIQNDQEWMRERVEAERDALACTMSEIGQLAPANYQDRDDLHRALLGILKTEPPGRRCRVRAFSLREYANSLHPDHGSRGHMMSEANRLDEVADIQNRRGGL